MKKRLGNLVLALALMSILAVMATTLTGCYIGKAEFRGEEMKMYPLFGGGAPAE